MNPQTQSPASLAAAFDTLLVDLDGTLMLAGHPIPHAAAAMAEARRHGARPVLVTNNASRTSQDTQHYLAEHGFDWAADDIVGSPLAAARLLADKHPPASPVLVVGAEALADALRGVGLTPVRSADEQPIAVIQGYAPTVGWTDLAEACIAIRAGADWVATNADATLPTDRGLLPGNGSLVQALATATDQYPTVTGKPGRALYDIAAHIADAQRVLAVGDRLDTDIAAAVNADIPSLAVLTGVNSLDDIVAAPAEQRPTYVAADLRGLIDPHRCARLDGAADALALAPLADLVS